MQVMEGSILLDESFSRVVEADTATRNLPYKLFGALINGVSTDVVINKYSDRHFIIISQLQKLGTLVSVEKDSARSEGEIREVYNTKVLLGRDDDEIHVAARFLTEQLGLNKPVLFSLALKELSPPVLHAVLKLVRGQL